MKETKRKNREPISISTSIKDLHLLEIKHYPDYSFLIAVSFIVLANFVFMSLLAKLPWIYLPVPIIILMVHFLYNYRPINCKIDKNKGEIDYFLEGILATSVGARKIRCSVSDIKQLKVKKYFNRFGHTFKVFLVLNNRQRLPLSSNKLGSADCRRFANRLSKFLEREIPIVGID